MTKKIAAWLGSVMLALFLYLFLWPVPIDPVAWSPDPAPALAGVFSENQVLQGMDFLELHRRYGCTLQTGGSDQWGNLTAGTELTRSGSRPSSR